MVGRMCENSHREANYLTLLFTIHHTNNDEIIDDILVRTMCSLDHVQAASLDKLETRRFSSIVAALPENILTDEGVEKARAKERAEQDKASDIDYDSDQKGATQDSDNPVNGILSDPKEQQDYGTSAPQQTW